MFRGRRQGLVQRTQQPLFIGSFPSFPFMRLSLLPFYPFPPFVVIIAAIPLSSFGFSLGLVLLS